jgi:hypothetical protein
LVEESFSTADETFDACSMRGCNTGQRRNAATAGMPFGSRKARFAVVSIGNVADRAQDLALFLNRNLPIGLGRQIEPANRRLLERADRR